MHSADGQADFVEANYTYFLYLMGSSSRGKYPPRFGGMLWYTNGDMRRWGSQYWWANTNAYYSNLMPANRLELMDPLFSMYSGMLDACALAAKQQWGSEGIYIPEITFFNGPEKLPDDIAAELQDLMLARKPFEERSAKFQWWSETKNRHNSRWNFLGDGHWEHGHYVVPTKGAGIFGHCTHILSDAARIGNLYYQRYEFTQDQDWLRTRAYPIIKGAAEFYRNFPNVKKAADGKYHIYHVNNGESSWDTNDTPNEIAGMRSAFSGAIKVSKTLGVDAELRDKWQEMLDNLAPAGNPGRGRRPPNNANAAQPAQDTAPRQRKVAGMPRPTVRQKVVAAAIDRSAHSCMADRVQFRRMSRKSSSNRDFSASMRSAVSSIRPATVAHRFFEIDCGSAKVPARSTRNTSQDWRWASTPPCSAARPTKMASH